MPGLGFIAPDGGSLFYVSALLMQQETRSSSMRPRSRLAREPIRLLARSQLEACRRDVERSACGEYQFLHQVTPNGRALSGTCC